MLAWNLSTTAFYKAGGQSWRLDAIRPGVCYIGMVYKRLDDASKQACCGAQMFLNSGEGLVFKGIDGPWYSSESREYHLDEESAKALMTQALKDYLDRHGNKYPKEIFIHGRARFEDNEWTSGRDSFPLFLKDQDTKLVGVRIKRSQGRRLFRSDRYTPLRGLVQPLSEGSGYLWTMGFVPRLQTYPGRELPNPLLVDICRGEADLRTVMADVLALTKVNFSACIYGDGMPVTLRFAGRVGGVLTAIPTRLPIPISPFKHYI